MAKLQDILCTGRQRERALEFLSKLSPASLQDFLYELADYQKQQEGRDLTDAEKIVITNVWMKTVEPGRHKIFLKTALGIIEAEIINLSYKENDAQGYVPDTTYHEFRKPNRFRNLIPF